MTLPEWVNQEAWEGYSEMRKKMRRPMTERAERLAIKKLAELRAKGYDPNEVLDQSTFMDWQGLFPLRGEHDGDGASRKTFDAIRRETSVSGIQRAVRAYKQVGDNLLRTSSQGNKRLGDGGIH